MSNRDDAAGGTSQAAGQGRLAQVIATRGGLASPEAPFVIEHTDYLMPHREAAWALLAERLDEAGWLCEAIQAGRGAAIAGPLDPVRAALAEIA